MNDRITICSWPRPMHEPFDVIQRNAFHSWVTPFTDIYLVNNEADDLQDVAKEIGAQVIDVERNEFGTPKVRSVIDTMYDMGNEYMLYINADTIIVNKEELLSTALSADQAFGRFMIVARSYDTDGVPELETESLPESSRWKRSVLEAVLTRGRLHKPHGSNIFLWHGDFLRDCVPDFALGRFKWDGWLMWRPVSLGIPLIDATKQLICVHQNHGDRVFGPEKVRNAKMCGKNKCRVENATHIYYDGEIRRLR